MAMIPVGLAALLAAVSPPHPGHSTYAEATYSATKRELQVSLGILAIDLEKTLSRRQGKRVYLDRTKGVAKLIEDYLAERFVITLPGGQKSRPHFVGRKDKGKNTWLQFTVSLVPKPQAEPSSKTDDKAKPQQPRKAIDPLDGVKLANRVLMELNRRQQNLVELRVGKQRTILTFTDKTAEQPLRKAKAKPAGTPSQEAKEIKPDAGNKQRATEKRNASGGQEAGKDSLPQIAPAD